MKQAIEFLHFGCVSIAWKKTEQGNIDYSKMMASLFMSSDFFISVGEFSTQRNGS